MSLFRKKSISTLLKETEKNNQSLKKVLGPLDLTFLGIGGIIGTGIFVLTGVTAAQHAGPALVISFILAGIACVFAGLCYAEFASSVPVAGSAYTYSYASLGEIIAWIIGWDLILEYGLAASAVSAGWSGYFQSLLSGFGVHIPTVISSAWNPAKGTYFDLPAIVIVLLITFLLSRGVKESTRVNNLIVFIKLIVVVLFIIVGAGYVKPSNWTPFMPFGFSGVATGAATVFFAYIGFDAVSTAAEEVKRPQRDLPIGIIASLVICTVLYIVVSGILTGIVPYSQLNVKNPVSFAMIFVHQNWVAGFISLGAICGITTVLLVMIYGQTRIFYAMSRDGLLPKAFSTVHPRFKTPYGSTWLTGIIAALVGGFVPLDVLADLVSIGTLAAFALVSIGVIVLRRTQPDLPRAFRAPGVPFTPIVSAIACVYLMIQLRAITWEAFLIWFIIGLLVYAFYGRTHSELHSKA
ncbi:amino acid permease [Fodinisporobacter ferrooxydans]|uniref:Amino acid permease n=1 Tax=Fodinisporobacter ferrooxydans TaxID=2901836 RepID=A0ABY4CHV7_9BACL|nr:amino acid permease [Alicyclobacillaceae bacterium MYW30-H2]